MKSAANLFQAVWARCQRALGAHGPVSPVAKGFGASGPAWLFDRPDLSSGSPGARLDRPYAESTWVMRAIQLKQAEISQAPVKFYEGDEEYQDANFDAWWSKPFIGPGKRRLMVKEVRTAILGWLDLAGEAFIVLGDDWLVPFPSVRSATLSPPILARPDRMKHVVRQGNLLGWEFTDGAGRRWPLLPEQVIHRPRWNPYDDFRGLAPVDVLVNAAEADYLAGVYVRNLMRNNGDQGVYVIAKGGVPSDPQREQIIAALRAKRTASSRGDFRPVFLTGDIAIEDAKAQAPDANLNNTRLQARHEVFIGLGVPASMADVQASYSVGSDSDRYRLITGTCMPQGGEVDAYFTDLGQRWSGKPIEAESDWDEHPVVQEVRRQRIESALKLWAAGWSWKVINDYLDLGMKPFPGWDRAYIPYSVVEVGSAEADPASDPAIAEPVEQEEPELQKIRLALLARQRVRCRKVTPEAPPRTITCSCAPLGGLEGPIPVGRDAAQVARWREYMKGRRAQIAGFRGRFTRWLTAQRREILAKVDTYGALEAKSVTRATAADFLFNLVDATATFLAEMRKQEQLALNAAGEEVFKELGRDDPFEFAAPEVLGFIKGRENKLRGVPENVFERIKATLQEGIDAGETSDELAARVRSECNAIDKGRANVIAQTETAAAFGYGRNEAMRKAGVARKAWLTSGNANVRESHEQAGQDYSPDNAIPMDEAFIVGGASLMFPGDPSGPAGEVINCHCVQIAVAAKEDEK